MSWGVELGALSWGVVVVPWAGSSLLSSCVRGGRAGAQGVRDGRARTACMGTRTHAPALVCAALQCAPAACVIAPPGLMARRCGRNARGKAPARFAPDNRPRASRPLRSAPPRPTRTSPSLPHLRSCAAAESSREVEGAGALDRLMLTRPEKEEPERGRGAGAGVACTRRQWTALSLPRLQQGGEGNAALHAPCVSRAPSPPRPAHLRHAASPCTPCLALAGPSGGAPLAYDELRVVVVPWAGSSQLSA
jgi:hypothetical protein